ncbi:MAG: alpha/beta hydrolase [Candidatus Paceibacterota bacterium]
MIVNRRQVIMSMTAVMLNGGVAGEVAWGDEPSASIPSSGRIRLSSSHQVGFSCFGPPDGTPVLYFHGTPSSRLEAEILVDACHQTGVFLVAIDRPGMGLSSYQADHTVANWPCDVEEVVRYFQGHGVAQRWGVLAYSGGTPFGLSCAQQLPQSISGLAILAPRTPGAPGVPQGIVDSGMYSVQRRPRLATLALNVKFRRLRKRPQRTGSRQLDRFATVDRQFLACHADWFRRTVLEAARCGSTGIVRDISLLPWPWNVSLSHIQVPVAIWQGTQDYSAPVATSEFLASRTPSCEIHLLQHEGHFTVLETASPGVLRWLRENV